MTDDFTGKGSSFPYKIVKKERIKRSLKVVKATLQNFPLCVRCLGQERLEAHHVIPLCDGGDDSTENCVTLCKMCHTEWHMIQEKPPIIVDEPFKVITDVGEKLGYWIKNTVPYLDRTKINLKSFNEVKKDRLQKYLDTVRKEYSYF